LAGLWSRFDWSESSATAFPRETAADRYVEAGAAEFAVEQGAAAADGFRGGAARLAMMTIREMPCLGQENQKSHVTDEHALALGSA